MTYDEFRGRKTFDPTELLAFAHGRLLDDPPMGFAARLPLPPLLMIDRIVEVVREGPRGRIVGERDVRANDWFFECHFVDDPVQPGCLGVDAVWQLLGFYCAWRGGLGIGRALGCGAIAFDGQIRPHNETVRYEVQVRRCSASSGATLVIGDATVLVDGVPVYTLEGARTGLFPGLAASEQPPSATRERA